MQNGSDIDSARQQKPAVDWPERFKVSIWLVKDEDHWSALAAEFDVVGMGHTQRDALENLGENLSAYLSSFADEGAPFEAARRRIPWKERRRLQFYAILTTVAKAFTRRDRRQPGDGRSRAVEHAQEDLSVLAHC